MIYKHHLSFGFCCVGFFLGFLPYVRTTFLRGVNIPGIRLAASKDGRIKFKSIGYQFFEFSVTDKLADSE